MVTRRVRVSIIDDNDMEEGLLSGIMMVVIMLRMLIRMMQMMSEEPQDKQELELDS